MERAEFQALIERLQSDDTSVHRVQINDAEILELTREQAEELVATYGANALMMLPEREREFFSWLRENDPSVWNDLWGSDEEPYLVSLGFLPEVLPNRRGFPICDLMDQENFCFTADDITGEDGKGFFDAAIDIVKENGRLTMEQAFVVEVWRAPIDQWRFAYNYNVPLDDVKKMVRWLLDEEIIAQPIAEEEESETGGEGE